MSREAGLFEFHFPDIGEGLTEGTVIELKVAPGQHVKAGEALAIVETDKVVTEMPSPVEGVRRGDDPREGAGGPGRGGRGANQDERCPGTGSSARRGSPRGARRGARRCARRRAGRSRCACRGIGFRGRPPRHSPERAPVQQRGYLRFPRPSREQRRQRAPRRCARLTHCPEARGGRRDRPVTDHGHGTRWKNTEEGPRNPFSAARGAIRG